jgi:NAD(P)-dependent dehydrogenase (short-subunit alcohol dehydrogenase family)
MDFGHWRATAGIGKALVARLAAGGHNVIAAARDPIRVQILDQPSHAKPGRVEPARLDFEEPATIKAVAREAIRIARDASLVGLVNMAGIIVEGPLESLPVHVLRRQFEVNVVGPIALTQALLPLIARARGAIINIGAVSARFTPPFYGPIAASKAALASLTDAMRLELAPLGIKVFLIEPGAMKTGIFVTSRAAREVWLTERPDLERRYRPALAAMDRAFEKSGADDPQVVVRSHDGGSFRPRR